MNQISLPKSKHFHHKDNGCDIKYLRNRVNKITEGYCKTHDIECCRCGWEWGWHGGTDNRKETKELWKRFSPSKPIDRGI